MDRRFARSLRFPSERNLVHAESGPFWFEIEYVPGSAARCACFRVWWCDPGAAVWVADTALPTDLLAPTNRICAAAGCSLPVGELQELERELAEAHP